MKSKLYFYIGLMVVSVIAGFIVVELFTHTINATNKTEPAFIPLATSNPTPIITPVPTPLPSPSPSPTPRPLTFAEMNEKYGPCVSLPVVFYHHVQTPEAAAPKKQTGLTVFTDNFRQQMQYLIDKGYNSVAPEDLSAFFDEGKSLPKKPILITFDDGYEDFNTDAYPILKSLRLKATIFIPTGLLENPDYMRWPEVAAILGDGLTYFGNHTWSHQNTATNRETVNREITTADTQLNDHGLNKLKVFAYPYGSDSKIAENELQILKYNLAFSTVPGRVMCKQQRLSLPRMRMGNGSMAGYGF